MFSAEYYLNKLYLSTTVTLDQNFSAIQAVIKVGTHEVTGYRNQSPAFELLIFGKRSSHANQNFVAATGCRNSNWSQKYFHVYCRATSC